MEVVGIQGGMGAVGFKGSRGEWGWVLDGRVGAGGDLGPGVVDCGGSVGWL